MIHAVLKKQILFLSTDCRWASRKCLSHGCRGGTVQFCDTGDRTYTFGLSDLALATETVRELHIPAGVVINRSDLGNIEEAEIFCKNLALPILARLPFQKKLLVLMLRESLPF